MKITVDKKLMSSTEFRKELIKIMPGYNWTVHRSDPDANYIDATGSQSSGYNRLSTLYVIRRKKDSGITYEVKSAGFGLRAPWLSKYTDGTLAQALRGLQTHYEIMTQRYSSHASSLEYAREKHNKPICSDAKGPAQVS